MALAPAHHDPITRPRRPEDWMRLRAGDRVMSMNKLWELLGFVARYAFVTLESTEGATTLGATSDILCRGGGRGRHDG
jgi:hypothetical protein